MSRTTNMNRALCKYPGLILPQPEQKLRPLREDRDWNFFPSLKKISFAAVLLSLCSGCATVGPQQQRLVSKANMVFSESVVFDYTNKLLPQTEPGSAFSGGAQSSGCTSCK